MIKLIINELKWLRLDVQVNTPNCFHQLTRILKVTFKSTTAQMYSHFPYIKQYYV